MPNPINTLQVMLTSAEKNVLQGALGEAPDSPERTSILSLLSRTGMSDGQMHFTTDQAAYLGTNLVAFMELPGLTDTKYDTEVGRMVAQCVADRFVVGAGS